MAFLAKIAVELKDAVAQRRVLGAAGSLSTSQSLAQGRGWSVEDVTCTYGPHDRPTEEQHRRFSVALVLAGTFQYRGASASDRAGQLMTPGSLFLGNPGQWFECNHEHGYGDRCLSFHFSHELFEEIAADAGVPRDRRVFPMLRLPATRELSPLAARASARLMTPGKWHEARPSNTEWEEIAIEIAALAIRQANSTAANSGEPIPSVAARITRAVRMMEDDDALGWSLQRMAAEARLSPFHFLRTFEQVTGITPHQYARRLRLRRAAARLLAEQTNILDIVMDCGFGDLSNFNRAFRMEFGVSPREFRRERISTRPSHPTR